VDRDTLLALFGNARPIRVLDRCDSTNRVARADPEPGLLVVTEVQTAGRGRRGRSWQSASAKNLLFSVVMSPDVAAPQAPRCVLLWAAAMAQVLDVRVKWPNDLVDASDRKLGGILAELELSPDGRRVRHIVLGVGINVNQTEFVDLPQATSLARVRGRADLDRAALLVALIAAVEGVDVHATLDLWRARSATLGRRVRVGDVAGVATAVREDGALLVDGRPILAGDVELLSPVR
jgi:BirA family transcriptional regulator, biotin operon repressor / biotin---[acetyl-CoA-carboxylase] ligase